MIIFESGLLFWVTLYTNISEISGCRWHCF